MVSELIIGLIFIYQIIQAQKQQPIIIILKPEDGKKTSESE
jgi:hypothetical protein